MVRVARRGGLLKVLPSVLLLGCQGLVGIRELVLQSESTDGGEPFEAGAEASVDASTPTDAGDAPTDASCDADFLLDPTHCGRCDHSCFGGACQRGVCQPVRIATVDTPYELAVDATRVYFTSKSKVSAVYKDGGAQQTLLDNQPGPYSIAVDDNSVYACVPNAHKLYAIDKLRGGTPAEVYGGVNGDPLCVALGLTGALFFSANNSVYLVPAGGAYVRFGSVLNAEGVAVSDREVFVTGNQNVVRVTADGGTTPIPGWSLPRRVAYAKDTLYVQDYTSPDITRVPLDGGAKSNVRGTDDNLLDGTLAVDESFVYWTSPTAKRVFRAPLAGGGVQAIATPPSLAYPLGIAVDDTAIYFTDRQGLSVWRVAKP